VTGGRLQRDRPRLTLGERSNELGQPVNDPPLQLVPGLGLGHVNGLSTAAERLDGSSVEGVLAGVLPPRPIEIPRRLQRSFAFGGAGAHRHRPLLGRQGCPDCSRATNRAAAASAPGPPALTWLWSSVRRSARRRSICSLHLAMTTRPLL